MTVIEAEMRSVSPMHSKSLEKQSLNIDVCEVMSSNYDSNIKEKDNFTANNIKEVDSIKEEQDTSSGMISNANRLVEEIKIGSRQKSKF